MWIELLASGVLAYELYFRAGKDLVWAKKLFKYLAWLILFVCAYCVTLHYIHSLPSYHDLEETLDTVGLAQHWGYPIETHTAKTEDGWLLDLHRIPHGIKDKLSNKTKPVLILQHGIQCSSDNWILNLPHQSPGFVFADAGYDVWMPNSRGNEYTRHEKHEKDNEDFWKFTSDEMQEYDLPAVFDKIEEVTGQKSFYYVGHSQGTFIMFARLASDPLFARRIKKFFALAPGASFEHLEGPFRHSCVLDTFPLGQKVWKYLYGTPFGLSLMSKNVIDTLTKYTCTTGLQRLYCANVFYMVLGPSTMTNVTRMPVYTTHIPAGTSSANVHRYCQLLNNGGMKWYDHPDVEDNLRKYGTSSPPHYNLSNVNVPIYIYSSPDDTVTHPKDLDGFLIPNLNPNIIMEHHRYPGFSHMDFLWGLNATDMVYNKMLQTLREDVGV